jgi:NADPH2:quinone reductase
MQTIAGISAPRKTPRGAAVRAVVVPAFGGPDVLSVQDVPEPEPGPGQVSVAVRFAGVNYTDVRNRNGDGLGVPPFIPGVEVAGTVRAVGDGVTSLRPGQPVAAFTRGHGYAEVATASEAYTVPLPGDLAGRPESAAMLITVPLVLTLLERVARVGPDEVVLLHSAAGGVGTVAGQLARRAGLRPLLGTAGDAGKAEFARRHGFGEVFGYDDFDTAVMKATGGRGVDVVLDPVGGDIRARSFPLLASFGRLVTYSNISGEPETAPDAGWLRERCIGYIGFSAGQLSGRDPGAMRPALEEAVRLVATGEIDLGVTGVYPLEQAAQAHRVFEDRAARGKLILEV